MFSVKSTYGILRVEAKGGNLRLFNFFWEIKALASAHVTTWRVIENKIASKVNPERRGVVVESNLCCLCRVLGESTSHFFFQMQCDLTSLESLLCVVRSELCRLDYVYLTLYAIYFTRRTYVCQSHHGKYLDCIDKRDLKA